MASNGAGEMAGPAERRFLSRAAKVRRLDEQMRTARTELLKSLPAARAEGMTMQAMADALGVSRQRISDMIRDAR